jgi:neutral ceramidase
MIKMLRLVSILFLLAVDPATAQEPDWKVGLARVKITPEQPVLLAGYASRNHPYEKIATDIFAKALALEDREGHVAVLVTTDLIGLTKAVDEPICQRLAEKAGLKREQILFNSSHIHSGPVLSGLESVSTTSNNTSDRERTVAYTKHLQDQLVDLVIEALQKRVPAKLSLGGGVVDFVMNRREFTPNGVILGVNARGLADRSVPVLRIDSPDGKMLAVLFGAATHNTTLTGASYDVCGDYAGFAQSGLEEKHPGAMALFALGCAGDSNPYPRGTIELSRTHGASLCKEVDRVLTTKLQPVRGPLHATFGVADMPLQPIPDRAELEKRKTLRGNIQAGIATQMLAALDKGQKLPDVYSAPVAVWQFGSDLTLVGLSGEVVVDYVTLLEKALGPNRLWITAYCNDVFGYVPTARVLNEGGYETRGLYTAIGLFAPNAQDVLVAKVRELAEQAGRKLP